MTTFAGDSSSLWVVASVTSTTAATLVQFTGDQANTEVGLSVGTDGSFFIAAADYATGATPAATTVTVQGAQITTGLHLLSVRMEADKLVLEVDGTVFESAPVVDGFGCQYDLNFATVGGGTYAGDLNSVVLSNELPSAAQIASMKVYFQRQYPELTL